MLGFSVYLGTDLTGQDYDYLLRMRNAGFSSVFTSLQIPEDDQKKVLPRLAQLTQWCRDLGLKVTADVSAAGLAQLDIQLSDLDRVAALQLDGLRLDGGVSMTLTAKLSHRWPIALNASTLTREQVVELQEEHADFEHLIAWHNYYPRPETGLDKHWLREKDHWLHHLHFKTAAFVSGDGKKRGPLFCGLPTLEEQRYLNPLASCLDLKKQGIDHAYIGDPRLSAETIEKFETYLQDQTILLHLDRPVPELCEHLWHNRVDLARDVIRLAEGRQRQLFDTAPAAHFSERVAGSVTVDNRYYARYAGELQITRRDLPIDDKVNVLAKVVPEDLPLLKAIGSNQCIRFSV